jgi:hypothetical protein
VRWWLIMFTLFHEGFDLSGLAQLSGDNEIVTDRPDITESAIVVPTASLQAENGATWTGGRHATGLDICQSIGSDRTTRSTCILVSDSRRRRPIDSSRLVIPFGSTGCGEGGLREKVSLYGIALGSVNASARG